MAGWLPFGQTIGAEADELAIPVGQSLKPLFVRQVGALQQMGREWADALLDDRIRGRISDLPLDHQRVVVRGSNRVDVDRNAALAHRDVLMVRQEEQESTPEASVVIDRGAARWGAEAMFAPGTDPAFELGVVMCVSAVETGAGDFSLHTRDR